VAQQRREKKKRGRQDLNAEERKDKVPIWSAVSREREGEEGKKLANRRRLPKGGKGGLGSLLVSKVMRAKGKGGGKKEEEEEANWFSTAREGGGKREGEVRKRDICRPFERGEKKKKRERKPAGANGGRKRG